MIAPSDIQRRIESALETRHVEIQDTTGGGDHFQVVVVSPEFQGRSRVQQHQLVYGALGDQMREQIHALGLKTLTPEEWERRSLGRPSQGGIEP
ncbi:MAG: BolA family protein [Myxococcota bacterium]